MKLRRCIPPHQLFFTLGLSLLLHGSIFAQHKIVTVDGRSQDVKILNVADGKINIQISSGTISVPLQTVSEVVMPAPAELGQAVTAYGSKDYAKSLALSSRLATTYGGLPLSWARQAFVLQADALLALGQIENAQAVYANYQKFYPGQGSTLINVGNARIAFAKKETDTARSLLEPVIQEALKQKQIPQDAGLAYSQAFYLMGQIQESEKKFAEALENYLRAVTIFYHDPIAANASQERADALRKDKNVVVP